MKAAVGIALAFNIVIAITVGPLWVGMIALALGVTYAISET